MTYSPHALAYEYKRPFTVQPLVLILDEHRLCRHTLASAIGSHSRHLRVQTALPTAPGIVSCLTGEPSAVLVVSCCTDSLAPLAEVATWRAQVPRVRIVVLTESRHEAVRREARTTPADAVLQFKADVPPVVGLLARLGPSTPDSWLGGRHLTPRETQIVHYVSSGYRNAQIAETIGIAEKTVKVNLTNIYSKLGIRHRAELAALAPQLLQDPATRSTASA